jgi:hypothetical protein
MPGHSEATQADANPRNLGGRSGSTGSRVVDRLTDAPRLAAPPCGLITARGEDPTAIMEELAPLHARSGEPHALARLGALAAEVRRRKGDRDGARAAVETH